VFSLELDWEYLQERRKNEERAWIRVVVRVVDNHVLGLDLTHRGVEVVRLGCRRSHRHDLKGTQEKHRGEHYYLYHGLFC